MYDESSLGSAAGKKAPGDQTQNIL
eukprot:SAG25_NODE_11157_length_312_cov_0.727700_1_plen_24_part_10